MEGQHKGGIGEGGGGSSESCVLQSREGNHSLISGSQIPEVLEKRGGIEEGREGALLFVGAAAVVVAFGTSLSLHRETEPIVSLSLFSLFHPRERTTCSTHPILSHSNHPLFWDLTPSANTTPQDSLSQTKISRKPIFWHRIRANLPPAGGESLRFGFFFFPSR